MDGSATFHPLSECAWFVTRKLYFLLHVQPVFTSEILWTFRSQWPGLREVREVSNTRPRYSLASIPINFLAGNETPSCIPTSYGAAVLLAKCCGERDSRKVRLCTCCVQVLSAGARYTHMQVTHELIALPVWFREAGDCDALQGALNYRRADGAATRRVSWDTWLG
jgi:hypothetical protein